MYEQSPEDVANGVLRIQLGDDEVKLPLLVIEDSEDWQATFSKQMGKLFDGMKPGDLAPDRLLSIVSGLSTATTLDLIAAYDRSHVLAPDARALRKRFNQPQAFEVFKAILSAEFPLFEAVPLLIEEIKPAVIRLVSRLLSTSSMSSPSPNGAEPATEPSAASTPELSSSSSGGAAKSASRASRRSTQS